MAQKTPDENDDGDLGRDAVPSVVGVNMRARGSSDEPSALTLSSQFARSNDESKEEYDQIPACGVARHNPQRVSSGSTPQSECQTLHYKDQVQSVIEPQAVFSETSVEPDDAEQGELILEDVGVGVEHQNGSIANDSALNSPSVLVHGQSVIPMAEAFVIAGSNNELGAVEPQVVMEPHIVQIEEQSTATFHGGGSRSTRTTVPTLYDRSNDVYGTEHSSDDNENNHDQYQHHDYNNNNHNNNNNNNNNSNKDLSKKIEDAAAAAVRSERRFWIRIIFLAIALNSLLVAGVVVGGFCGSGKCGSSDKASDASSREIGAPEIGTDNGSPPPLLPLTEAPARGELFPRTLLPSVEKYPEPLPDGGEYPETAPDGGLNDLDGGLADLGDGVPEEDDGHNDTEDSVSSGHNGSAFVPEIEVSQPPSRRTTSDPANGYIELWRTKSPCLVDCYGATPNDDNVSGKIPEPNVDEDFAGPDVSVSTSGESESETSSSTSGVSIGVLVGIALVFEIIIVSALYLYSRRWLSKRSSQTQKLDQVTPGKDEEQV